MCISAAVLAGAALFTAAAGTAVSISSANAQASAQQMALNMQREQMRNEQMMAQIKSAQAENLRLEDFRRTRASNLAALAASGLNQNISFLDGVAPAEERALQMDLANIRLGLLGTDNRLASEIRINRLNSSAVASQRSAAVIGAGIKFVGDAASIGNFYNTYRTPSGGGNSSFGGSTAPSGASSWGSDGWIRRN